jgi:hypothetical protein
MTFLFWRDKREIGLHLELFIFFFLFNFVAQQTLSLYWLVGCGAFLSIFCYDQTSKK